MDDTQIPRRIVVVFPKMENSSTSFGVKYTRCRFGHSEFGEAVEHPGAMTRQNTNTENPQTRQQLL